MQTQNDFDLDTLDVRAEDDELDEDEEEEEDMVSDLGDEEM